MSEHHLGEFIAARTKVGGYVRGPSTIEMEIQASDTAPIGLTLAGIDAADSLIMQLIAARNEAWPWPPLVIAQPPEVQS